jgi:hypothetical protein
MKKIKTKTDIVLPAPHLNRVNLFFLISNLKIQKIPQVISISNLNLSQIIPL